MKKLTCEMCGSTDLLKDGGVFVCQSCGCKYTVEEAKKMMVEGTVQVEGTVKIDNSDKVETYRKMATNAYDSGNTSEAYQYFLKVLEIEPTDYLSVFYKGMCQGWETTLARPRVSEAVAAYYHAEPHIPNGIAQTVKAAFIKELIRLMSAWFEKAQENFYSIEDWYQSNTSIYYTYKGVAEQVVKFIDGFKDVLIDSEFSGLLKEVGKLYCSACEAMCDFIYIYTDYSQQNVIFSSLTSAQKQPYLRDYDNMIFEVRKHYPDFKKVDSRHLIIDRMSPPVSFNGIATQRVDQNYQMCLEADRAINQKLQRYKDEIVQKRNRERREKYWSEHAAEKQEYEARLVQISEEIKTLKAQNIPYAEKISDIMKESARNVPAEGQLTELKQQQKELVDQKAKLGLFASKQKKALQAQIDSLQEQIEKQSAIVMQQKKALEDDVAGRIAAIEAERSPITNRLSELEGEKTRINYELTKDR